MIELSAVASASATSVAAVIDVEHLSSMTLGDRSLEREVLELFDRQATMLIARMHDAVPAVVSACAHTLKGSARGIGAWAVADAADAVELAIGRSQALEPALLRLVSTVSEAKAAIRELLRTH